MDTKLQVSQSDSTASLRKRQKKARAETDGETETETEREAMNRMNLITSSIISIKSSHHWYQGGEYNTKQTNMRLCCYFQKRPSKAYDIQIQCSDSHVD